MLSIEIYASGHGLLTFSDEIENISWSLKNTSDAPFVVSLPRITASILLASTNEGLRYVNPGDIVHIRNSKGQVKLTLSVISSTVLADKGKTEISCSGKPLPDAVLGTGVFDLSSDYLNDRITKYRLKKVDRPANVGSAIIRGKEDYLLSYLWGGKELLHLTPAEYSGGNRYYDWETFKEGGLGVDYKILPSDIVSFDVSPARPLIAGLQTPQRIEGLPEPATTLPLAHIVKPFFVEGTDVQAVYTRRYDSSNQLESQVLTWSDGHINDLGTDFVRHIVGIFTDVYVELVPIKEVHTIRTVWYEYLGWSHVEWHYAGTVVGVDGRTYHSWIDPQYRYDPAQYRMLTTSRTPEVGDRMYFAEYYGQGAWIDTGIDVDPVAQITVVDSGNGHLLFRDKYTSEVLDSVELNDWAEYFDLDISQSKVVGKATITTPTPEGEIMWFNYTKKILPQHLVIGVTDRFNMLTVSLDGPGIEVSPERYNFVSTMKGEYESSPISAVFVKDFFDDEMAYFRVRGTINGFNIDLARVETRRLIQYTGGYVSYATPVDAFDNRRIDNTICVAFASSHSYVSHLRYTHFVNLGSDVDHVMEGEWQFLNSGEAGKGYYLQAPIIQLQPKNINYFNAPLRVLDSLERQVVVQSIAPEDFRLWAGMRLDMKYQRYRENSLYAFYTDEGAPRLSSINLFDTVIPWASRSVGSLYNTVRLQDGEENNIHLPFITAPLEVLDVPYREKGRMIIDIASFAYTPRRTDYIEVDIFAGFTWFYVEPVVVGGTTYYAWGEITGHYPSTLMLATTSRNPQVGDTLRVLQWDYDANEWVLGDSGIIVDAIHSPGEEFLEVSVEDLEMPALMSYVDVITSYDLPPKRMKVTGIDFDYQGVVRMRISGILVDS